MRRRAALARTAPRRALLALLAAALTLAAASSFARDPQFCGRDGVWLQILGGGGPELDDGQAMASYVIFVDGKARLLVNPGPGSSAAFDRAGASFADLEAVVFTNLDADHSSDFPAFIHGSAFGDRNRPLPVFGPDGNERFPDTASLIERLIGAEGAYPQLAGFLEFGGRGYRVAARNVPAIGNRRWAQFGNEHLRLSAIPVHHGDVPALAWRADVTSESGPQTIVFTGNFNNRNDLMAGFAEGAGMLVTHHAIPDNTRGELLERHVTPTQIGRIAARARVRMVILGHRMQRTRGVESITRAAIEQNFNGPLVYTNDLECWGL